MQFHRYLNVEMWVIFKLLVNEKWFGYIRLCAMKRAYNSEPVWLCGEEIIKMENEIKEIWVEGYEGQLDKMIYRIEYKAGKDKLYYYIWILLEMIDKGVVK